MVLNENKQIFKFISADFFQFYWLWRWIISALIDLTILVCWTKPVFKQKQIFTWLQDIKSSIKQLLLTCNENFVKCKQLKKAINSALSPVYSQAQKKKKLDDFKNFNLKSYQITVIAKLCLRPIPYKFFWSKFANSFW